MTSSDLTLERVLTIWWAFAWRAGLSSLLAGAAAGFIGGVIVGAAGAGNLGAAVGGVLGWLASIPCSVWALREALRKSYASFDLALTPRE